MVWTQAATEAIVSAGICLALILVRCGYRMLRNCKVHSSCHRTWHADDAWMAFSIIPLAARSVTIALSFSLAEKSRNHYDYVVSRKLLIVSRLMYAFFLWCMKFCLVSFYSRFENGSAGIHRGIKILWSWMVITFLACVVGTLAECVPMSIFWATTEPPNQKSCYEGKANLLTVATLNLVTDLTLILFPIPILWRTTQLNFWVKVQLTLLFGVGIIVVAVTITRIPLILDHNFSQNTRTLWASVEIISACIVANAAFYYALIKDIQSAHNTLPRRRSSVTATSLHWIQGDGSRASASPIAAPVPEKRTSINPANSVKLDPV